MSTRPNDQAWFGAHSRRTKFLRRPGPRARQPHHERRTPAHVARAARLRSGIQAASERAGEAVCEKILAEVAPPPSATGWRREWSRGHRGPRLTFDDLSVRSGGVI